MSGSPATSATGGSASSQADSLDGRAWNPRPKTSMAIKALLLVVPLVVGVVAVKMAMEIVPRPHGWLAFWTWMIALVVVSFVASLGTQRILRRFAPLAMLFKMSLVFPDEAPSRFKAAIRSGSTRSLARASQRPGATATPEQAAAEALLAMISRLSQHDRITRGHVERVRAYSVMLGEQIGLSRSDLEKLNWSALMHDIGKLEIPADLLNKPGRPTAEEWAVLRTHPAAGLPYVEPLRAWLGDWVDATTQHHERYDGLGYPRGLSGKHISLAGRIVAIADAYDVMTAARSYKKPLPPAQARAELTRNSGRQFDPHLVRGFLEISLGRLRRAVGPIGWLAHLPDLIRTPLTAVASSSTGIVAAGAVGLATVAGAAASPVAVTPRHQSAPYVEELGNRETTSTVVVTLDGTIQTSALPPVTEESAPVPDQAALLGTAATSIPSSTAPATSTTAGHGDSSEPLETTPVYTVPPPASPPTPPTTAATPTTPPPTVTTTDVTTTTAALGTTVAVDDAATVRRGKTVSIHVVQNDIFAGSTVDGSTLVVVTDPAHGPVTVSGQNIVYEAEHNYEGIDSFTYSICSLSGYCDEATVIVTVTH